MDVNVECPTVSLEDARNGIRKAIAYLKTQAHAEQHIVSLHIILSYFDGISEQTGEGENITLTRSIGLKVEQPNESENRCFRDVGEYLFSDVCKPYHLETDTLSEGTILEHLSPKDRPICELNSKLEFHSTIAGNDSNNNSDNDSAGSINSPDEQSTVADLNIKSQEPDICKEETRDLDQDQRTEFKCDVCQQSYNTADYFQTHLLSHTDKELPCKADTGEDSRRHESLSHTGNKPHQCIKCEKSYKQKKHLRRHAMRSHANTLVTDYQCPVCLIYLQRASSLKRHIIIHTKLTHPKKYRSKSQTTHKCKICGRCFYNLSYLKAHENKHSGQEPFRCDICRRSCMTSNQLKMHRMTHSEDRPIYSCAKCEKQFKQMKGLSKHMRKHQNTSDDDVSRSTVTKFKCTVCEIYLQRSSSLKRHMVIHTEEKPFQCSKCDMKFRLEAHLHTHEKRHAPPTTDSYPCIICGQRFSRLSYLKAHASKHSGQERFKCDICPRSCITKSLLNMHKLTHSEHRPHKCSLCISAFKQKKNLKAHMRKHADTNDPVASVTDFQCSVCERYFQRSSSLKRHKVIHTQEEEEPFKCSKCDKKFRFEVNLQKHETKNTSRCLKSRPRDRLHLCNTCGKCFTTRGILKTHQQLHTANPHHCVNCNRHFRTLDELNVHARIHSTERGHMCALCNKFYTTAADLNTHVSHAHNQNDLLQAAVVIQQADPSVQRQSDNSDDKGKSFSCECGKNFTLERLLKAHRKLHSGMPYICDVCSRGCISPSALKIHMSTHTGERAYPCAFCNKRFRSSSEMNRHTRIHTGNKPYTCSICSQCFGRTDALKKHMDCHM